MTESIHKKTLFVTDLQDGQQVHDLFLISRKNSAETKAGKPYLALTLMDRSGEVEARVWDNAQQLNQVAEVGRVVEVRAQGKLFRDQLQLNITSLQALETNQVSLGDFMPASRRSAGEMDAELTGLLESVIDHHLALLLKNIFQGDLRRQFLMAPAAKMMHHACLGGLAEHTLSICGLALKMCDHYPDLDRDLLLAGALLHDIGKIQEFDFSTVPFSYTDSGRLVGHLVLGSEMVRKQADTVAGLPAGRLDQLIHLILSHHGRHEFGSPCLPMTREAIVLHHLDDIDAKMNFIGRLSEQVDAGEYQWSDYQRTLERFLLLRGPGKDTPGSSPAEEGPAILNDQQKKNRQPESPEKPRQPQLWKT
jgi:3'-5' exoribonuclease